MIPAQEKLLVSLSEFLTSDIFSAVWGYSTRTLLDFGNLVSNIWGTPRLQEFATAAGSLSTLFGVKGSAQTLFGGATITIAVAGLVFFAVYTMKALKPVRFTFPRLAFPLVLIFIGLSSATASALITATALSLKTQVTSQFVLGEQTEVVVADSLPAQAGDQSAGDQLAVGGTDIVRVVVPAGNRVNLRSQPDLNASVLAKIEDTREAVRLDESQDWTKVTLEDLTLEGWVATEFIEEGNPIEEGSPDSESVLGSEVGKTVLILDTPTGWVRVRETPWGTETGKVYPGDRLKFLDEVEWWVQVELPDGKRGWASKEYAKVE